MSEPFITRKDIRDCIIENVCDFQTSQYFQFLKPLAFSIKSGEEPIFPHDSDALSVSFFIEYLKREDVDLSPALMRILVKALETGNYTALRQVASWTGYRNFTTTEPIAVVLKPFLESGDDTLLKSAYKVLSNLNLSDSDVYIPIAIAHLRTQPRSTQTFVASFLKTKTKERIGEHLEFLRDTLSSKKVSLTAIDWLKHFLVWNRPKR